jgi:hypothetical protein
VPTSPATSRRTTGSPPAPWVAAATAPEAAGLGPGPPTSPKVAAAASARPTSPSAIPWACRRPGLILTRQVVHRSAESRLRATAEESRGLSLGQRRSGLVDPRLDGTRAHIAAHEDGALRTAAAIGRGSGTSYPGTAVVHDQCPDRAGAMEAASTRSRPARRGPQVTAEPGRWRSPAQALSPYPRGSCPS